MHLVKVDSLEINELVIFHEENRTGVIREVFKEDCYKIQDIPEGSTVIDIGAHIGTFTLRCAKERNCNVYAYEPSPRNYRLLKKNIEENKLTHKVKTFQKAIGWKNEKRSFYTNPEHTSGSSFFIGDNPDFKDRPLIESIVETVTLEQIFIENNLTHCNVLKIDCEEAEREIFRPESKPIFKKTSYVILEWHYYDGHVYSNYLQSIGFTTHLTGCGSPPPPYEPSFGRGILYGWNQTHARIDIQKNPFDLRERKMEII